MTIMNPFTATRDPSDARLVAEVGEILAVPRADPADSFVLHAPLELVARAALLPFVQPSHRERARDQITAIASDFEDFGPPVPEPAADGYDSVDAGAANLVAAIDRGELDDIDQVARWLGRAASAAELQALLSADIIQRLAAAAHAPIFLFELPRIAPRGEVTGELLRGLARELGRAPEWQLRWMNERSTGPEASADAMFEALAATPLGTREPGATPFIYPVMSRVDEQGIAVEQLGDVIDGANVHDRAHAVLRAAAWSMLLEPGDHAPYGWSHCLTMPQAVLGLTGVSDPRTALAVAATYVVGFRSALAQRPLEAVFPTDDPGLPLAEALDAGPTVAAAAVWYRQDPEMASVVGELATRASIQRDAHLVKYVLACLDAAATDRTQQRLYLAAAASLVGWWAQLTDGIAP
ncbi:MAG: hypothetical protein ACXWA9_11705 [Acidimicrobiia bacterium]